MVTVAAFAVSTIALVLVAVSLVLVGRAHRHVKRTNRRLERARENELEAWRRGVLVGDRLARELDDEVEDRDLPRRFTSRGAS